MKKIYVSLLAALCSQQVMAKDLTCKQLNGPSKTQVTLSEDSITWKDSYDSSTGTGKKATETKTLNKYHIKYNSADPVFYEIAIPKAPKRASFIVRSKRVDQDGVSEREKFLCKEKVARKAKNNPKTLACSLTAKDGVSAAQMSIPGEEVVSSKGKGDLSFDLVQYDTDACKTQKCSIEVVIYSQKAEDEVGGRTLNIEPKDSGEIFNTGLYLDEETGEVTYLKCSLN